MTNKKPAHGANRETGFDAAIECRNHSPNSSRNKGVYVRLMALASYLYEPAIIGLLVFVAASFMEVA